MADLEEARQHVLRTTAACNKQAKALAKARETQRMADARYEREWRDWVADPNEFNQETLIRARSDLAEAVSATNQELTRLEAIEKAAAEAWAAYLRDPGAGVIATPARDHPREAATTCPYVPRWRYDSIARSSSRVGLLRPNGTTTISSSRPTTAIRSTRATSRARSHY